MGSIVFWCGVDSGILSFCFSFCRFEGRVRIVDKLLSLSMRSILSSVFILK